MVGLPEYIQHRAALRGIAVEHQVQPVGREPIGQLLGALPVIDTKKGIVGGGEADAFRGQLTRQPAVTVEIGRAHV